MLKIKKEDLTKLQHNFLSLFEIEDGDDLRGRSLVIKAINVWLNKITDNKEYQNIIYDIVNMYKFDRTWDRTYIALIDKGFEIED